MAKGFANMSASEIDVALHLRQQGKSLGDIAGLLGRSKEAIRENTTPALVKKKSMETKGKPQLITDKKFAVIMALVERMIKDADCRWEVTLPMVKRRSQFKGSLRTLSNAFHKRGVYFRPLREKLLLTAKDVAERKAFANKYLSKSATAWVAHPHAIIDNKTYPVYLNGQCRDFAARRAARGSYRTRSGGLRVGHVKPRKSNTSTILSIL
jgi:hypothetical protein